MKEYYYKGNKIIEINGVFTAYVLNDDGDIDNYDTHSLAAAQAVIDKIESKEV